MNQAHGEGAVASNNFFARHFDQCRAMVILRGCDPDEAVRISQAAWAAGIALVEVTVHVPEALPSLEAVLAAARAGGRLGVGAGTVTTTSQVATVSDLGATFTVSPGCDPSVASASLGAGLPHLPGVASATDIQAALRLGLEWVKAFPASVLGPGWVRAMLGPFPNLAIVATGGVNAGNAHMFLDAGARGVAAGSAVVELDQLDALSVLSGTE